MPRVAANDDELLDEIEKHLEVFEILLQQPSVRNLVAARDKVMLADSVLTDGYAPSNPRWNAMCRRCTGALSSWDTACRNPVVHRELIELLTAKSGGSAEPTLWGFSGSETDDRGAVALCAFAPSAVWPSRTFAGTGRFLCLWGPHWVLPALKDLAWIDSPLAIPLPASRAEAEVAATLWDPNNGESAYQDLHEALSAARAILAT